MFEEFYEMYEPEEQEVVALINRCIGGGFNWKGNFWEMTVVTLGTDPCTGWNRQRPTEVLYYSYGTGKNNRQIPVDGPDRSALPRESKTGRPGIACKLRPFTKDKGGSRMDAKGIINYYGMLRILKALEGHGFTQKELKRITAHLELEVERGLFCSQSKQAA